MRPSTLALFLCVSITLATANAMAFYPSGEITRDLFYDGFEIKSPGLLQGYIINRSDRERNLDIFIYGTDIFQNHIQWETAVRIVQMKPFEKVPFRQFLGPFTEDPNSAPKLRFRVLEAAQ